MYAYTRIQVHIAVRLPPPPGGYPIPTPPRQCQLYIKPCVANSLHFFHGMLLAIGYFFIVYYWLMSFEWMQRAACKGLTHKMFPGKFNDKGYVIEAREICARCPVSEDCLDYALQFVATEMHGVWAGLTNGQLAREQRRRGMTVFRPTTLSILNQGSNPRKPYRKAVGGKKRGPKPKNTRGS